MWTRPCHILLGCYQLHLSVCLSVFIAYLESSKSGWAKVSFVRPCWREREHSFPHWALWTSWQARDLLWLLGQHDLQCEKGKPKSPSNENIKVNASQVRNLLPLTPINSYKTLVLSCPWTGTQTLDFIKLNFLFLFTRPVMCVWTNHHLLLSGLVHFPGPQKAEGTSILLHGAWYRRMK